MYTILKQGFAVAIFGTALFAGGCASVDDVQKAQATADQALSTAQSAAGAAQAAQQSADRANSTAQSALSAAQQATDTANQAAAAATKMHKRGERG